MEEQGEKEIGIEISFNKLTKSMLVEVNDPNEDNIYVLDQEQLFQAYQEFHEQYGRMSQIAFQRVVLEGHFDIGVLREIDQFIFQKCIIHSIEASYANLSLLQIEECKIGFVLSKSLRSNGHINIDRCELMGPFDDTNDQFAATLLDFRNTQIDGHFMVSDLTVSEELEASSVCFFRLNSSDIGGLLSLNNIETSSDIEIKAVSVGKNFEFRRNKITAHTVFRNLFCGGDMEIFDNELSSTTSATLSFQHPITKGSILVKNNQIVGRIFLHSIECGINLDIDNTNILANETNVTNSIEMHGGEILNYLLIKDSSFHGQCYIHGTQLRANLEIRRSNFRSLNKLSSGPNNKNALFISACQIRSDFKILNNKIDGSYSNYNSKVDGDLHFTGNEFSLSGAQLPSALSANNMFKRLTLHVGRKIFGYFLNLMENNPNKRTKAGRPYSGVIVNADFSNSTIYGSIHKDRTKISNNITLYVRFDDSKCLRFYDQDVPTNYETGCYYNSYEGFRYEDLNEDYGTNDYRRFILHISKYGSRGNFLQLASAQPYSHFSSVMEARGDQEVSDLALIEMKRNMRKQTKNPVSRVFSFLFDILFGYGLSKAKATLTLFIWIAIGSFGINKALEDELFILDMPKVVGFVTNSNNGDLTPANLLIANNSAISNEIGCGNDIQPVFYAIEIILPIIDLGQEKQCILRLKPDESVRQKSSITFWWTAKYLYTIIGWLIVSLSLITYSGVLRRKEKGV